MVRKHATNKNSGTETMLELNMMRGYESILFWNARELEELHTERRTLQETADAARTRGWQHEADLNSARETLTALQDSQARERTERRDQAAQETAHRRDEARRAQENHESEVLRLTEQCVRRAVDGTVATPTEECTARTEAAAGDARREREERTAAHGAKLRTLRGVHKTKVVFKFC